MTINNNEQKYTCAHCGQTFDGFGIETERGTYCEDCASEVLAWCDSCETWHEPDEGDEVRVHNGRRMLTQWWCNPCIWSGATRCQECGDLYADDCVTETREGRGVCNDCLESEYRYCDECCEWVTADEYDDEEELCLRCSCGDLITRYHGADASFPRFYADGETIPPAEDEWFIGVEIEVDKREYDPYTERKCVKALQALLGERAVYERDSSLTNGGRNGFEIVVRPHSARAFDKDFPLDEVLATCRAHGYKAHDIGTCGYHMHISRRYFGATQAAQERAIGKCIAFYDGFYRHMVRASRRDLDRARQWADSVPVTDMQEARKEAKWQGKSHSDRYAAVNTTNPATVEFRLMRGTLNAATLHACTDILRTIARNARRASWDTATTNPAEMLKGITPATRDYLARREAFTEWLADIVTTNGTPAEEVK